MERVDYFPILLKNFSKWYINNHGKLEDEYKNELTKDNIESLSKDEFIDFFYNFTYSGGKIQSGGYRTAGDLKNTMLNNYSEFREYILEPYLQTFDLKKWLFYKRKRFNGWGIGVASIYLNRVNKNKYSIINKKTIDSLKELEYDILKSPDSWNNYFLVNKIQSDLIRKYDLENYFVVDAINEFIVGEPKYKNKLLELKNESVIDNDIAEINDQDIPETEKKQLVSARKGQGLFRKRVIEIDKICNVTNVEFTNLLIASHIKPWKGSTNIERLDGNNGLLLSPHIDKLFDKFMISFSNDGYIIIYDDIVYEVLEKWNIDYKQKYYNFSKKRIYYLEKHREVCEERNNS